jgi:hypothetical protein
VLKGKTATSEYNGTYWATEHPNKLNCSQRKYCTVVVSTPALCSHCTRFRYWYRDHYSKLLFMAFLSHSKKMLGNTLEQMKTVPSLVQKVNQTVYGTIFGLVVNESIQLPLEESYIKTYQD